MYLVIISFIQQSLKLYFYGDRIEDWFCSRCKTKRNAIKKMSISKIPEILVIHLKRFEGNSEMGFQKNSLYLDFPLTNLDIIEYISPLELRNGNITSANYDIYSISNHYGTMNGGHYTSFCKNRIKSKYVNCSKNHNISILRS